MGQLKNFTPKELVRCNYCDGIVPEFMKEFHMCPAREAIKKTMESLSGVVAPLESSTDFEAARVDNTYLSTIAWRLDRMERYLRVLTILTVISTLTTILLYK